MNFLLIESLRRFHCYYGDDFRVECPTGSGNMVSIADVADELSRRLSTLFLSDDNNRRPVLAYNEKLSTDPNFRDLVLFHEYFDGDSGRGVGASHQTGWSALIASLLPSIASPKGSGDTATPRAASKRQPQHTGA